MRDDRAAALRVGVLGHGAIGAKVAGLLRRGEVPGAELAGVAVRGDAPVPMRARGVRELVGASDVVVEAAGQRALWDHGAEILDAGRDLVAVSVGALADDGLFRGLTRPRAGRLLVCQGALGGLDVVRAAALGGPLTCVRLTSSKPPASLVQPWMDDGLAARLRALRPGDEPVAVHDGSAREAATRFPRNANVAATLALAAGDWSAVRVRLVADPAAVLTRHVVEFRGRVGEYRFELANHPDPGNPATSGLVAYAVARTLADLVPGTAWRVA
ncbi:MULTISPECIES: aspartate dehydrogenase domain-containing protein [Actinomadura]|uniref:L-aspartate dehydrogenase n=1 Tax=Actinomadura yumaensis TaxID=111807 RepID=A0ABW2CAW8_9ACTN|nr:aspartate dehydrogenase domain-containing protein [Actinomadura sp. J1-007]